MNYPMRIGIIGQPCLDEIVAPNGELRSRSPGGILYSYAALEAAMRKTGDGFVPLTWTATPDREIFQPLLAQFTRMETQHEWLTDSLTNRVRLIYRNDSERIEQCPTILPSFTKSELEKIDLKTLDGLLVNMISGFDISIETLEWVRVNAPKLKIHLDIHALILGALSAEIGIGRKPSGIEHWQRWISAVNTVQMNELEARWIAAPQIDTERLLITELRKLAQQHEWPTKAVIITRAERGASLYFLHSDKEISITPPPTIVIDTTGSGDVFAAQFIYSLLQFKDYEAVLRDAIIAATKNTTRVGVLGLLEGL